MTGAAKLATMLASVLSAAAPIGWCGWVTPVTPSARGDCFGPCHVPGCDDANPQVHRHFSVCNEGTRTKIQFEAFTPAGELGASTLADSSGSQTATAFGVHVEPKPGETWGSVDECSDIVGSCDPW